jgi:DNA-binding response OmpR family regulator
MINVLVFENDSTLLKSMCAILSKNGYKSFPAENGTAALGIIEKENIDLMVTDISAFVI